MKRYASIDWSGIAADAIRKSAAELELFNAIASKSQLKRKMRSPLAEK